MSDEWVVIFVDMEGSTEIKYRSDENQVGKIITRLYRVIHQLAALRNILKFTGDGAMIGYEIDANQPEQAPLRALGVAVRIIRNIDQLNYLFDGPPIHIRVGIASGPCTRFVEGADDLIGRQVDLADRLCAEAIPNSLLVDEGTLVRARLLDPNAAELKTPLDGAREQLCRRRLSLKGIPRHPAERFWDITVDRFANPSNTDLFANGLVALYLDRETLKKELPTERLITMAKHGSHMLVAGRTLLNWKRIEAARLLHLATERNLKIWFMIVSEDALQYLDSEQQKAAKDDFIKVLPYFQELLQLEESRHRDQRHFHLFKSDLLILDGITCADLCFKMDVKMDPAEGSSDFYRHVALQDINATAQSTADNSAQGRSEAIANAKATILWACTCPDGNQQKSKKPCMAHGLERRTQVLFEKAKPMSLQALKLDLLLKRQDEGLRTRNNHPRNYLARMAPYLKCIHEKKFADVPAPVCVQMQVSSRCSTYCKMCDHWKDGDIKKELALDQWQRIFANLADFGVRTAIFSGGEALVRTDIADLLRSARSAGLRIGLLTNGMLDKTDEEANDVREAIADCADWVAISVDGTEDEDETIRNLQLKVVPKANRRADLLRNFCAGIRARNPNVKLSATVTLQSANIRMDLDEACRFIREQLKIPQVNFKFVTGATNALSSPPSTEFRPREHQIDRFLQKLNVISLPQEQGNNLAYLTRTVNRKIYNVNDIAQGAPVQSYYIQNPLRCFTPFLFSLIDYDGEVYTCCHLYRDNHVLDEKTPKYRTEHGMGSLTQKEIDFDFKRIWNGSKYATERERLTRIDPRQEHFEPCGECTRHCQHNSVLSGVEQLYEEAPDQVVNALEDLGANYDPVWF